MKNKFLVAITGFMSGAIIFIGLVGIIYISYRFTGRGIDILENRINKKKDNPYLKLKTNFNLTFEWPEDLNIFEAQESGVELSQGFAIEGKHSLLVEFPPEQKYPGITFDLFGKDCLDWQDMKSFSFDVVNSVDRQVTLIIQIRSGEKYPKKQFKKEVNIPGLKLVNVEIKRSELEERVDLAKSSHLTIFMSGLDTTFRLYFDNMRVNK